MIINKDNQRIYGFYFGNASEIEKVYMEGKLMEDKLIEWYNINLNNF